MTSQGVSAVSWTDECVVAAFDVAVVLCFLMDISDSDVVGAVDHAFGVPLLDGVSVAQPTYDLVWLEESDTVLDRGSPRLGEYPFLSQIHLIFWIRAARTYVLGCRVCGTASGMWNWSVTLLY